MSTALRLSKLDSNKGEISQKGFENCTYFFLHAQPTLSQRH